MSKCTLAYVGGQYEFNASSHFEALYKAKKHMEGSFLFNARLFIGDEEYYNIARDLNGKSVNAKGVHHSFVSGLNFDLTDSFFAKHLS